jgi:hypothetical protein
MMPRRRFLAAATLILLVAAGLRLAWLAETPPGLHYDEAANAQLVSDIAFGGYRPVFITSYTGKETLWFYLAAGLTRLAGAEGTVGVFVLRLTSSLIGIATVAVMGWLVRRLYSVDHRRDGLALLAMAVMAIAFWHNVIGRLAFRAISQPLLQGISLGLLWWGITTKPGRARTLRLGAAGLAIGLTAYTYLAARLFPIPLAAALIVFAANGLKRRDGTLGALAVCLAAALIAFAPLGLFFARNPEAFGTRINQVGARSAAEALGGFRAALGMLFVAGDPLARFNLPGRPLFGPALGALLMAGYAAALIDLWRARSAHEGARGALLAVWPFAMLAPTALATRAPTPSNLRAIGLAPLVALYPALGIMALLSGAGHTRRAALGGALALILAGSGGMTLVNVRRWRNLTALYYDNHAHVAALAAALNEAAEPGESVYMATDQYEHPTLAYLTESYALERSIFGQALVTAPEGNTLIAYTRDAPPPPEWLEWMAPYRLPAPPGPDGDADYFIFRLPPGFAPDIPAADPATFGGAIRLEGAALRPVEAGRGTAVDLLWTVLARPAHPGYFFAVRVCDAGGRCWGDPAREARSEAYQSGRWEAGERVLVRVPVRTPVGLPPGDYTARVRVRSDTAKGLPLTDAAGGFAGLYAEVGPLVVLPNPEPDAAAIPFDERIDREAAPGVTLLGYRMAAWQARPGERIDLTLYWRADDAPAGDDAVRLALDGGPTLYEGDPAGGGYPTGRWGRGEIVADRYTVRVPADTPPGEYALRVRLGDGEPIRLGALAVAEAARRFETPPGLSTLDPAPTFGGQVRLAGYDAPAGALAGGETLPVTLAWEALAEMESGYTVFVHLVDVDVREANSQEEPPVLHAEGGIAAQRDRPPAQDGAPYPTDLWLPGEIVADTVEIALPEDIPPGEYGVRVGLYIQATGQRLSVPGTADNAVRLPVTITIR